MAKGKNKSNMIFTYENYGEAVELFANIPDEIFDAIEREQTVFSESIAEKISNELFLEENDIDLDMTCIKSGKRLRVFDREEFIELCELHGIEKAKYLLEIKKQECISPKWYYTDSATLDKLQKIDPAGYCVYAIGKIFNAYGPKFSYLSEHERIVFGRKWLREQRAIMYDIVNTWSDSEINNINELMRRFLAIAQTEKVESLISWHTLIMPEIEYAKLVTDIKNNILKLVEYAYKKKRVKTQIDYYDIMSMRKIFVGHGQFAGQKRIKGMTTDEQIAYELRDLQIIQRPLDKITLAAQAAEAVKNKKPRYSGEVRRGVPKFSFGKKS